MQNYSFLLSGATGFLGQTIHHYLPKHTVCLGRNEKNDIVCDLSKRIPKLPKVDTVIHNAGKAHIMPKTAAEAQAFFDINEKGTINLLKGLQDHPPRQFIFISTVAVYGLNKGQNISESAPLLGETPYAKSKIKAENAVKEWCATRNIPTLILRLPLVYGLNPPGNLGAISAMIHRGRYIRIKGNAARKSIVLAEDIAKLISRINGQAGIYNLTDGHHPLFSELEDAIALEANRNIKYQLPYLLFKLGAKLGDLVKPIGLSAPLYTERLKKMTATLTFDDSAAKRDLNWEPQSVTEYIENKSTALP